MHAKSQEIQDFIGTDLLKIVSDAFGDVDGLEGLGSLIVAGLEFIETTGNKEMVEVDLQL